MTEPLTDLGLVPVRRLVESPVDAVFELAPGDRTLVEVGESVVVGAPIAERLRDARLEEVSIPSSAEPTRYQTIWVTTGARRRTRAISA